MPVNAVQVLPPLRLYWRVEPGVSPVTFTAPELVIPSVELIPESLANFKVGTVETGSRVKLSAVELLDTFPATSV